jgi:isoquinoline 1-oxidoreductase alpha subunit
MATFTMTVNGTRRDVDAPGEMPLLWILRDRLQLTGTKYGCGVGQCGACTVLQDGRAVRSCRIPIASAAGHAFTTIEGLGTPHLHRTQAAWIDEDVAQCGYCQPGMILETVALLEETPAPTAQQIDRALAGHVCRCGTYARLRAAVHRAAGVPR